MTKTARVYGGSLYDLAAEEKLDGQIMEQMIAIRQIFRENPGYLKLLGEPAIPEDERLKMIEEAFGGQAERYLVNFLKLLCERKILREFAGCCEEFIRRYNSAHGIAEAVVTSAVKLSDTQIEALKADSLKKISEEEVVDSLHKVAEEHKEDVQRLTPEEMNRRRTGTQREKKPEQIEVEQHIQQERIEQRKERQMNQRRQQQQRRQTR